MSIEALAQLGSALINKYNKESSGRLFKIALRNSMWVEYYFL